MSGESTTYLLIDGENIDGTLGDILGRKPEPNQRPRWQQLRAFAETHWEQPVRALFFINATTRLPAKFVQALIAMGYRPVPLSGRSDQKVVDIGIIAMMGAIRGHGGDVMLASHDADFAPGMVELAEAGRRVAVVGFGELTSDALQNVPGVELVDLETRVGAFDVELPRVKVIPVDRFDPVAFL